VALSTMQDLITDDVARLTQRRNLTLAVHRSNPSAGRFYAVRPDLKVVAVASYLFTSTSFYIAATADLPWTMLQNDHRVLRLTPEAADFLDHARVQEELRNWTNVLDEAGYHDDRATR
jgi:hypothetical protein